jgi:hypothetical protein
LRLVLFRSSAFQFSIFHFQFRRPTRQLLRVGSGLERGQRVAAGDPAALLGDPDRYDVVLRAVEPIHYGACRDQRDLVLARLAAEQDSDADFICHDKAPHELVRSA